MEAELQVSPVWDEAGAEDQAQLAEVPAQVEAEGRDEPPIVVWGAPLHQVDEVADQDSPSTEAGEEPESEVPGEAGGEDGQERPRQARHPHREEEGRQPAVSVTETSHHGASNQHPDHEDGGQEGRHPPLLLPLLSADQGEIC